MVTKSALCALAARDDVESRLVERRKNRYRVTHGPLEPFIVPRAGTRNWTLLVSGLNHHNTEAEKLLNELQSPAKTDDATQQLFKLGKSYPEVRAYLASHLPAITQTATIA